MPHNFQEPYFVLDHLDDLLKLASIDFAPSYQRIGGASEYDPGTILESDVVITRGKGSYHAAKRQRAAT